MSKVGETFNLEETHGNAPKWNILQLEGDEIASSPDFELNGRKDDKQKYRTGLEFFIVGDLALENEKVETLNSFHIGAFSCEI